MTNNYVFLNSCNPFSPNIHLQNDQLIHLFVSCSWKSHTHPHPNKLHFLGDKNKATILIHISDGLGFHTNEQIDSVQFSSIVTILQKISDSLVEKTHHVFYPSFENKFFFKIHVTASFT